MKFERKKVIDDIVKAADHRAVCLNCKFSYITEETGFGFCYYDGPGRPPTLFVKPITEMHSCMHWKRRIPKERNKL